jgi:hypothetical protein
MTLHAPIPCGVAVVTLAAAFAIASEGGSSSRAAEHSLRAAGTVSAGGSSVRGLSTGHQRHCLHRGHSGHTASLPARIVREPPGPFFSDSSVNPLTNGWRVSDLRTYTAIDAGRDANNPRNGFLGIFRTDYVHDAQAGDAVRVKGSGAVRITKAPEGRGHVQTRSQCHGVIYFKGKTGVKGRLRLADDTVVLTP